MITDMDVAIRWMIKIDLARVLDIENQSFEFPWTEDEFIQCLRNRNCIGLVAKCDSRIAGYMIYELHKHKLHVLSFAVAEEFRRRGVGRKMVEKLVSKLSATGRRRLILEVRESNLASQLFFRSCGFKCVSVLQNYYDDTPEDAYVMQFVHKKQEDTQS